MGGILQAVNDLFAGVMPISDFLWDVPTNFNWYSSIPILGQYYFPAWYWYLFYD